MKNKDCNEEKGTNHAKGMEQDQAEVRGEPDSGDSRREYRANSSGEDSRGDISCTGTSSLRKISRSEGTRFVNLKAIVSNNDYSFSKGELCVINMISDGDGIARALCVVVVVSHIG